MESRQSEKRFALLIDADNVSAKYLKPIMDELSKYGTVTYKRIYGDWTLAMHSKWKNALLENSITPIQQFGYTQGKNATDSAMIIDAMDILYTHSVEGFCIVSSDSDFTRLAARIRESGLTVIGMGEQKTPTPFRRACDIFTTLELLAGEKSGKRKASASSNVASDHASSEPGEAVGIATKEEIERAVVDIIADNQNNGKATGLGEVGSRLLKRYPDFDVRSYGTNLLSKLLGEFASVKITKDGSNVAVELADAVEVQSESVEAAEAVGHPERPEQAERPERPEQAERPEHPEHPERPVQAEHPEHPEHPEQLASSSSTTSSSEERKSKRPRRRRKIKVNTEGADAVPAHLGEILAAHFEATEATEVTEAVGAVIETAEVAGAATTEADVVAARNATSSFDGSIEATSSDEKKPSRRKRTRRAKKASAASEMPSETPEASGSLESSVGAVSETLEAVAPEKPEGKAPDAFVVAEVNKAGKQGVDVTELAKRVRAKFRSFKVTECGFRNFRAYVQSLDGVVVEKREGAFVALAK